jgi:hypothetical protein
MMGRKSVAFDWSRIMTLCPVAIAAGCKKCPIFSVCPLKGVIGDYKKEDEQPPKAAPRAKAGKRK